MIKLDGYDDCVMGVCHRYGQPDILVYDLKKVIKRLQKQGMSEEEALEWYDYNMIGAWVGDETPAFVTRGRYKDLENDGYLDDLYDGEPMIPVDVYMDRRSR